MANLIHDAKEQISSILNKACEKAVEKGELPAGTVLSGSVEIPKTPPTATMPQTTP